MRRLAHRLWRALPAGPRRATLAGATRWIAPRIDAAPDVDGPVTIAGFFRCASGLGQSARLAAWALAQAGVDVRALDLSAAMMRGVELPPPALPHPEPGAGVLFLHVNGPYVPLALSVIGRRLVAGKLVVGYWSWELPRLPPGWTIGFPFVHHVWAPSPFTADAIRLDAPVPVDVAPHPVCAEPRPAPVIPLERGHRERRAHADTAFRVVTMLNLASGYTRKNPLAAILAFRLAFGDRDDARLIVKVMHPEAHPAGFASITALANASRNVLVLGGQVDRARAVELAHGADAVLSLHRSEGFGLVLAEAMQAGVPVVATGWSGNMGFMDDRCAMPVEHTLVPARDPEGHYELPDTVWAEPSVEHAATALRRLRDDPALAAGIGRRAAATVAERLSADRYAEALEGLIHARKGTQPPAPAAAG
jgi:glycosyltransferase involved in cell wall biosynthesis